MWRATSRAIATLRGFIHPGRRDQPTTASRGQILVIFSSMLVILLTFSALAVDLGWLWTNALRVQRSADAAALAGVVHLPGDQPTAYSTARNEATKNGYQNGVGGVSVVPVRNSSVPRRLNVTVTAPVKTFFLGLVGMPTIDITRRAEADFVLPVPMGSPENWYGVGEFRMISGGTQTNTGARFPTAVDSGGAWGTPNGAYASGGAAATVTGANAAQVYRNFGLVVTPGFIVQGLEVIVNAKSTANRCQIGVELWNGSSWSSQQKTPNDVDATYTSYTLGASNDLWGSSWDSTKVANGSFKLRLVSLDPGSQCANSDTWSVDFITVRVTSMAPLADAVVPVNGPGSVGALRNQGFWGAVFTKGGVRQNGDRYAPANWAGGSSAANPDYDANGYDYTVEVGGGGGVWLFDATFCGTGQTTFGGWYGAGDHWTGRPSPPGGTGYGPVTTRYRLYNTNGTEYALGDDVLVGDSGTQFANEFQTNQSGSFGSPQRGSGDGAANCASNPYHNGWYQIASGMAAGVYRLNVNTSDPANNSVAAENLFSIYTSSAGKPRVYGGGKMAAYTNLAAGRQSFYLAQIGKEHAGKTMDITLFDPGDVSGDAFLRILSPGRQRVQLRDVLLHRRCAVHGKQRRLQRHGPHAGEDARGRDRQLVRQLRSRDQHSPAVDLWQRRAHPVGRDRGRLVEDRVRGCRRQRHHDLGGRDPWQPRAAGDSLITRPRGVAAAMMAS